MTLGRTGIESSTDRSPHLLFQRADRVDIQDHRQFPPRLLGMFALEFALDHSFAIHFPAAEPLLLMLGTQRLTEWILDRL